MYVQRWNAMNRNTTDFPTGFRPLCAAALLLGLLAGCAGFGPKVSNGQTVDEVVRAMGQPTARYSFAGGVQRFEYATGPFGRHTYMVDFDAAGRVTGWDQVLTELNFNSLPPNMTRDEVLHRIGRPSERFYIGWQQRDVWAYRYPINECRWFMVSMGQDGRVVDMGYGLERGCDGGKERSPS